MGTYVEERRYHRNSLRERGERCLRCGLCRSRRPSRCTGGRIGVDSKKDSAGHSQGRGAQPWGKEGCVKTGAVEGRQDVVEKGVKRPTTACVGSVLEEEESGDGEEVVGG